MYDNLTYLQNWGNDFKFTLMKKLVFVKLGIYSCDFWKSLCHFWLWKDITCKHKGKFSLLRFGESLYVCLSVCLSIYLSIYLSACLPQHVSECVCLSICLSVCLSIYLSIYLHVSVFLSVCLPAYLSIYLFICLSICLSVCLSVYLSIYLPIYLSIYLSVIYVCTLLIDKALTEDISQLICNHSCCTDHDIVTFIILHF